MRFVAYIPRYLGFAALSAWTSLLYSSNVLLVAPGELPPLAITHLFSTCAVILCAIILALLATRLTPLQRRRELLYLASIAGALGTSGVPFASVGLIDGWWFFVCVSLTGMSGTILSIAWMERFAAEEVRHAFLAYVSMMLSGALLYLLVTLLPQPAGIVLMVLLPVVSAFALRPVALEPVKGHVPLTGSNAAGHPTLRQLAAATPLLFILIFGIISFAHGAFKTLQLPNDPVLTSLDTWLLALAVSALAILIAGVFAFLSYRVNTALAFYIAIPLIACAALLLVIAPELPAPLLDSLSGVGIQLVSLLVWLLLIRAVRERQVPAVWCFALLSAVQFAGTILGQFAAILVGGNLTVMAFALLVMLIIAALVVVSAQREAAAQRSLNVTDTSQTDTSGLEHLAAELAREAGLSPREQEVLLIWAAGHNSAHIEKTLFISKNTVKTHLSHIYAKTGAANREELLALLDQLR